MQEIKVGDRRQITTKSLCALGTVTTARRVDTDNIRGLLYQMRLDDGYKTGDIFLSDGEVTDSQAAERQSRSWMPLEFVYATGNSVDWKRYPEDTTTQRKIANSFVKNFSDFRREGRGLYICSSVKGSGKTMLSCALANEILKKYDVSVKFINQTDYIELVKLKDDDSRQRIDSIMDAGLLIFDDVGAQVENREWISTALFRLIDRRYVNHLPTIFTSNYRLEELKTDDRIYSRIYAVSVPVIMPEVSIRQQIADKHTTDFLKKVLDAQ